MKWIQNTPPSCASSQQICGCAAAAHSVPTMGRDISLSTLVSQSLFAWQKWTFLRIIYHYMGLPFLFVQGSDWITERLLHIFKAPLSDLLLSPPSGSFLQSCWISIIPNTSQMFRFHSSSSAFFAKVALLTPNRSETLHVWDKSQKKVQNEGGYGAFKGRKHSLAVCFQLWSDGGWRNDQKV